MRATFTFTVSVQSSRISVYFRHLFGVGELPPPKKKLTIPPKKTAAKLCALSLFFGRGSESQIYHGNFLLIDNKHRKLFVIMQPKGCKFMRKMHQNMFSGRQTYFWCILRINLHHFKFWKSVNIWRSYGQEFSVLIFLTHGTKMSLIISLIWSPDIG